ncbi:MAG: hypothetical protein ACTSPL_03310 [Candidatus Odinarchaeia archaeon]
MLDKTVEECVDILLKNLREFQMVKHQMPEFRNISEKLHFAENMFARMNETHEKLRQVIRLGDKLISTIIKISETFRKCLHYLNAVLHQGGREEISALNFSYMPHLRIGEVERLVNEAYTILAELRQAKNLHIMKALVKATENNFEIINYGIDKVRKLAENIKRNLWEIQTITKRDA